MCELTQATQKFWEIAVVKFPQLKKLPMPDVRINARLRTTAGRSLATENWIDFNPHLFVRNKEIFLLDTVPHELAHNIADRLFNERVGHGAQWHFVFESLTGNAASRLHSMDVTGLKKPAAKTIPFACRRQHTVYQFTPQRMAWVRKGKVYLCKTCNDVLKPI